MEFEVEFEFWCLTPLSAIFRKIGKSNKLKVFALNHYEKFKTQNDLKKIQQPSALVVVNINFWNSIYIQHTYIVGKYKIYLYEL